MAAERLRVPLQAPDVGRMPELERRMALVEPALALATARLEAAQRRWRAALEADDIDGQERERSRAEAEGAYVAWTALARPVGELREEWAQLQVVGANVPICTGCGEAVGSAYPQLTVHQAVQNLCLRCLDVACGHDRRSRSRPISHQLGQLASVARRRETDRRIEALNARRDDRATNPRCWCCTGALDDPLDDAGIGRVTVRVVAVAPGGDEPELGAVCLCCVERELRPAPDWIVLLRTLREGVS